VGRTAISSIDLNADLAEHDGQGYGADDAILDLVSSASIACGAHAGTREVMERTAAAARDRGVSIGAHPGYPDRHGFGRRETGLTIEQIMDSVRLQLLLLAECCERQSAHVSYVKPHGALYNRAARDEHLAGTLAECVAAIDRRLVILAPAGSAMEKRAREAGLTVAREAFIDRAYLADGSLVSRDQQDAVLHDADAAASLAVTMAREGIVPAVDGSRVHVMPQSLCVHSDSPNVIQIVRLARQSLEAAGIAIRPFVT